MQRCASARPRVISLTHIDAHIIRWGQRHFRSFCPPAGYLDCTTASHCYPHLAHIDPFPYADRYPLADRGRLGAQ